MAVQKPRRYTAKLQLEHGYCLRLSPSANRETAITAAHLTRDPWPDPAHVGRSFSNVCAVCCIALKVMRRPFQQRPCHLLAISSSPSVSRLLDCLALESYVYVHVYVRICRDPI